MPDYSKKIVVEGKEFAEILSIFSNLVQDKFFKPIPYKDYTRMRKFNKEVEFRFCPSDGAVIIVPTEPGISLLYWSKKGDNSFADFLWGHFEEELKDMHPDEKPIYDLFGLATKAEADTTYDCAKVSALVSELSSQYCDSLTYSGTCSADKANSANTAVTAIDYDYYSNKTAIDGVCSYLTTKNPYEECVEEIASLEEKVEHTKKKVKEYKEELQEKLDRKVSIEELDYILKESKDDLLDVIDESRYDICQLYDRIDELEKRVESVPQVTTAGTSSNCYPVKNYKMIDVAGGYICDTDNRKEKESMDTSKMFNFDFGPVASHIRMSPYGLAMKNADGKYVSYDKATGSIMDVEIFNFDAQKFLYKMPVAIDAIAVGDIVVHMRKAMFVRAVSNGTVSVIDIFNGEVKDIVPTKSPFGFNFITKVVSLIDMSGASANSPFGNMLPLMMMGEGKDFKDILPMMFFANGNGAEVMKNPLMMYALLNNDKNADSLGYFLALTCGMGTNIFAPATPAHKCGCPNHNPNPENGDN